MKEKEKKTEDQEFDNKTPEDTAPESIVDTDTLTGDRAVEGEKNTDKVSEPCDDCKMWQDKYTRLSAEFDNFRKRTLKEKLDLAASGGETAWKVILPVADDFERAIKAMTERKDANQADLEGVKLICQKLSDAMKSQGVTPIEALGEKMNVDYFDAVAKVPVEDEAKKGLVIDVVQTGYMLKDKVLRFAKVVVGE